MILAWLVCALTPALAADEDELQRRVTWELTLNGNRVGEREVVIKYLPQIDGLRRILEVTTEADATVLGTNFSLRQRLTAFAFRGPSSFQSVVDFNGERNQVQSGWSPVEWRVTVNDHGRQRTFYEPADYITLSTADLMDPESAVFIGGYQRVRMLSAETGDILEGPVESLGYSTFTVSDVPLQVEGYAWTTDAGRLVFYYTLDGILARYETRIYGQTITGQITVPPPVGVDDQPVDLSRGDIEEREI